LAEISCESALREFLSFHSLEIGKLVSGGFARLEEVKSFEQVLENVHVWKSRTASESETDKKTIRPT
jgi:hypothetical protein